MTYISLRTRVYHVHVEILTRPSEVLDGMFTNASGLEGSTVEHPFVLDNHDPAEWWDAYLSYVYVQHHTVEVTDEPSRQHWMNLLAFGHKYQAPGAMQFAKSKLEAGDKHLDPFPHSLRLYLARLYGFRDWVDYAVPKIVLTPLQDLKLSDYQLLGDSTLHSLIQLHTRLTIHRTRLFLAFPHWLNKHTPSCARNEACSSAWRAVCDALASLLFCRIPMSERSLALLLTRKERETAGLNQMTLACANLVIESVEKGLTGRDDNLIQDTIRELSNVNM
ncbi:hypothetical protein FS749_002233 [Ceratobasidium sp. UAMH 11750]|nr:hypothetical protein FS749_002233 [Ceratobasidium sp. UAMH 11750]